ncbi:MAG: hypothetical protein IKU19_01870 [Clostridia bacterium]|nr:hypothetical protein [Clostridia bacterium]
MKKLIAIFLILCAVMLCFSACMRGKDRAENNGVVTDNTTKATDTEGKTATNRNNGNTTDMTSGTTDRNKNNTTDKKNGNILDDAGNAVSDAVEGATDAVDDILGGGKDSTN